MPVPATRPSVRRPQSDQQLRRPQPQPSAPDPATPQQFFASLGDGRQVFDALERVPGAMFMVKDLHSRYLFMSRALKEAIHLPADFDVTGRTDFDLFPRIIAENFRQNDRRVFQTGQPLVQEIHATGFFDHPTSWCYSSKYPLHDQCGRVIGLITINEKHTDVMGAGSELDRLLPAIDHISRHYAMRITIAALARLCGFSSSHFMRIFRQRLLMTPRAYIEQVRLFHASDSLRRTAASVAEIALAAGFYDPSSFVKRFKRFTGLTPLHYRRQQQHRTRAALAIPAVP